MPAAVPFSYRAIETGKNGENYSRSIAKLLHGNKIPCSCVDAGRVPLRVTSTVRLQSMVTRGIRADVSPGPTSYGAYVPDLPGCVAVSKTAAQVKKLIAEAIAVHLEGLREDGLPIPDPSTECEYVEV